MAVAWTRAAGGLAAAWTRAAGLHLAAASAVEVDADGWRLPGRGRPAAGLGLSWTRAAGRLVRASMRGVLELWTCSGGTAAGRPCAGIPPVRWDGWWPGAVVRLASWSLGVWAWCPGLEAWTDAGLLVGGGRRLDSWWRR